MMGKVDIAAAILQLSVKEASLKVLEERTGISAKNLAAHLKTLESKNLITLSKADGKAKITKRGVQFLDLYNSIHSKYLTASA